MPDPAERFLDAAVAPLGDNAELEVAGRRLLEEMMAGTGKVDDAVVDQAVLQLSRNDATRMARRWRMVLNVIAVAVFSGLLAMGFLYVRSVKPLAETINSIAGLGLSSGGTHVDQSEDAIGAKLDPADRLLLLGDSSQESKSLRWKALWDSDPERPAYFAHYAVAHIAEHKELPPDFLETADRLDPGNAWFPLIAAGVLADQAADERKRTEDEKKAKVERSYEIKDKEKLREAIACLNQAAMLSRFESHQRELLEARVFLLPKRTDSINQLPALAYMAGITCPNYPLIHLPGALYGECERLSKEGDRAELERLIRHWESVARRLAEAEDFTMVDGLAKRAVLSVGYRIIAKESADLLPDQAKQLQAVADRFDAHRNALKSVESERGNFKDRASLFAGMTLPIVSRQALAAPEIRDQDLKPGRLAEHEFLSKGLAACMAVAMAVAAASVATYRFRGGELRRKLSARLTGVLGPADWGWILGAGVLVPILALQGIARLPIIGARELSIHATKYLPGCGLHATGLWLLVILPVLLARWRLGKQASFLGFRWRRPWIGWIIALPIVVLLPVSAIMLIPANLTIPVSITFVVISQLAQVWVWVVVLRGLFSRQEHLLKRLTLSRTVVPAYVWAMLLMAISVMVGHRLERYWIQQDRLMEIAADQPSMSRYEYQATQALRQEIIGILEVE